ncbi:MAG TPA: conjugal transfer protein TrbF [Tepidisphaeraceae bacterium]|nr:conjugal transfer protein TrbF [Tepidisphaeraceae bacterium]
MSFGRFTTSYGRNSGGTPIENPYARAAAAWDERIGSARVQARNWRYAAFAALLLALISTCAAAYLGIKKQVATYVVEVDKAGMPGRITLASEPYRPDAAQVGYFVAEIVRLVRERPLDPVVMRKQWTKAYQFLAGPAVNAMNEYAATDSGLSNLPGHGATARTVEISSILQKAADTYQVRWLETTYSNGVRRGQEEYTGLFQVRLMPPRDEADAFKNPIGVYVTNFTWGREFSGPVVRESAGSLPPSPAPARQTPPVQASPGGAKP